MPTYFYPFILGLAAVIAATLLKRRPGQSDGDRLASKILYVVAVGCVIVGVVARWLFVNY